MDKKQSVVIQLLRLALGNEQECSLPEDVPWMEVMSLAERQGGLAIAFDGVQYFDKLSNHNCMPDIDSLMEWLGQATYNEAVYEEYEKTVAHLSKLFGDQSLRAIVMKGYGCSLNYPKPNHRPCGT